MEAQSGDSERIHHLDNLRALAMMLGVYLHGALAYAKPSQLFWLATDRSGSVVIDASFLWIHLFRMSLFFLLSGYSSKLMVKRKGLKHFLKNRGIRIALPFVLFYPVMLLAMTIVIVFGLSYVKEPEGLMKLIADAGRNPESRSSTPWSTMHLWFLYYLLMFSLIAAAASRWTFLTFDWLFRRQWLLVLSPLLLVPAIMEAGVPLAAPESFVPTWWAFLLYGAFYWLGWQLFGREEILRRLQPWCWPLVFLSFALFIPYYWRLPVFDIQRLQQATRPFVESTDLVESALTAYLAAILTIASLLLGQRYLSRSRGWLKFCADASYWVYLIHLPVVIFLQTLLIPVEISAWVKLFAVTFIAWLFCMATYVVFVRYTPVGWMLNGKRSFP